MYQSLSLVLSYSARLYTLSISLFVSRTILDRVSHRVTFVLSVPSVSNQPVSVISLTLFVLSIGETLRRYARMQTYVRAHSKHRDEAIVVVLSSFLS